MAEIGHRLQRVNRAELVHMGQEQAHPAGPGLETGESQQRIQPDQPPARAVQPVSLEGEVFAAVSCQSTQLPGCHSTPLCRMEYALVCAPGFHARYFSQGLNPQSLASAPGVAFDQRDDMHMSYIQQEFALEPGSYPCHTVRSSEAFIALAKAGVAYCLIPVWQIADELATGSLLRLPAPSLYRHLYWHRWILERGIYKQLSEAVIAYCQTLTAR